MLLALGHGFELNHCALINGLIGLLATAVFRDIVALTMKIAQSWWLGGCVVGWKASGRERKGPFQRYACVRESVGSLNTHDKLCSLRFFVGFFPMCRLRI